MGIILWNAKNVKSKTFLTPFLAIFLFLARAGDPEEKTGKIVKMQIIALASMFIWWLVDRDYIFLISKINLNS